MAMTTEERRQAQFEREQERAEQARMRAEVAIRKDRMESLRKAFIGTGVKPSGVFDDMGGLSFGMNLWRDGDRFPADTVWIRLDKQDDFTWGRNLQFSVSRDTDPSEVVTMILAGLPKQKA